MRTACQMLLVVSLALTNPVWAQTRADSASGTTTTLKVDVRLVPVRAVVRDAHGNAVGNLTKEDFQIFDNGKPQVISQFSAERYDSGRAEAAGGANPEKVERNRHAGRYTVYVFDDLHLNHIDLVAAREAADKHRYRLYGGPRQVARRAGAFGAARQGAGYRLPGHDLLHGRPDRRQRR